MLRKELESNWQHARMEEWVVIYFLRDSHDYH